VTKKKINYLKTATAAESAALAKGKKRSAQWRNSQWQNDDSIRLLFFATFLV